MKRVASLVKIEKEIEKLSADEQLKLIEKLVRKVRNASGQTKTKFVSKKELSWKKLYGLGKGLWKNEDAQNYVNNLREIRA